MGMACATTRLLPAARPRCTGVIRSPTVADLAWCHDNGRCKGRTLRGSPALSRGTTTWEQGATLDSGRWLTKNKEGSMPGSTTTGRGGDIALVSARGLDRVSSCR
jgi:hypothetical protein